MPLLSATFVLKLLTLVWIQYLDKKLVFDLINNEYSGA